MMPPEYTLDPYTGYRFQRSICTFFPTFPVNHCLTGSQTNFIQQPLPSGSTTGAGGANGQSGALDKGQRMSTGLTTFYQFWYLAFATSTTLFFQR